MPCLHSVSGKSVFIIMLSACLSLVASSLWGKGFAYYKRYFVATFAAYRYFRKASEILSHVGNKGSRAYCAFCRV